MRKLGGPVRLSCDFPPKRRESGREDDWFLGPDEWKTLYQFETVDRRRQWFLNLREIGRV
jgi:hypothetical protein